MSIKAIRSIAVDDRGLETWHMRNRSQCLGLSLGPVSTLRSSERFNDGTYLIDNGLFFEIDSTTIMLTYTPLCLNSYICCHTSAYQHRQ